MWIFKINRRLLDWCQRQNNKLYEKHGLTDRVLNNQVKINKIRNAKDLTDENIVITDDGFVQ